MQQLGIHFSIYFNSFVLLHFRCKTGILECKKWFLSKLQKKNFAKYTMYTNQKNCDDFFCVKGGLFWIKQALFIRHASKYNPNWNRGPRKGFPSLIKLTSKSVVMSQIAMISSESYNIAASLLKRPADS